MNFTFADHIFLLFPTQLLGAIALVISAIQVYKYCCRQELWCLPEGRRPAYLVRALNWFVFGTALLLFPHLDILTARATLRVALAFVVFSEIAYNITYLGDIFRKLPRLPSFIFRELYKWTRKLLRS